MIPAPKVVLDGHEMRRAITRISHEIVERNAHRGGTESLALVGVERRGSHLAARLQAELGSLLGSVPALGRLDIAFYRDDLGRRLDAPVVGGTQIDFPVEDRPIVIVDDVLYTGRTARAAIEALFAYGRPACVQLATLIDRGHRELPIRPDYIGKNLPTARNERVHVHLAELDGIDEVAIASQVPVERLQ